jgi:undecaprenyl diphosphate synthase
MALIDEARDLTSLNTGLTLVIAFNYGARAEITKAVREIAHKVARGELQPDAIGPEHLSGALDTAGIPDPDLLIRTSGEMRLSNFLLWQTAYTEFVFLDAYWPEFGYELLDEAIKIYHARDRRFGGLTQRSTA